MLCAIHQPHYLPWLPYIHKAMTADVFILLDDVEYTKNGWQNRNKVKGPEGWMYLTVPVSASLGQSIRDVGIAPVDWGAKHLKTLISNYSRAPHFAEHRPFFEDLYQRRWTRLSEVNEAILRYCLEQIGIETPVLRSSDLGVPGAATERLIKLCAAVGADAYLSGAYALQVYLDPILFTRAGITLQIQAWHCPSYRQQFPRVGFIPDLSILDLLFNEGPGSLEILRHGGESGP